MPDEGFDPIGWAIKIGIAVAIFRSCVLTDVNVKEVKEAVKEVYHEVQVLSHVTEDTMKVSTEQQEIIKDLEVSKKKFTASELRKKLPSGFTIRVGCPRCSKMVDVQDASMLMCSYCQYTLEKGKDY